MPITYDSGSLESGTFSTSYGQEFANLEGLTGQHPDTGMGIGSGDSYVSEYTTRLFGAPFQLLNSVDYRFPNINKNVGNEYLRNLLLNSPILYIKPGMPKYTGKTKNGLWEGVKSAYITAGVAGSGSGLMDAFESLASGTVFKQGSGLQKRMYGFRETYYDYMQHVNYMCRSVAIFMELTSENEGSELPTGIHTGSGDTWEDFSTIEWANYRMMHNSEYKTPMQMLDSLSSTNLATGLLKYTGAALFNSVSEFLDPDSAVGQQQASLSSFLEGAEDVVKTANETTVAGVLGSKITTVQFMVEPISFEESLTNETAPSQLETTIDAVGELGSEISWITNSNVDAGVVGDLAQFLGNVGSTAADFINVVDAPVTGGFVGNLFSGAIQSLKGQKMIYPDIYKRSESRMDYNFSITLSSPYGDKYNYYTNIVVPLCHLIALTAPRMVTANTVASPFLVQAYIPGMCSCNLGIISSMNIVKNPDTNHVSVHGFPLTVKVTFTIKELYNAMAISPADDPSSFLYNESLNDYLSNISGLIPSMDTYVKQRQMMFQNLDSYFTSGAIMSDFAENILSKYEDFWMPDATY